MELTQENIDKLSQELEAQKQAAADAAKRAESAEAEMKKIIGQRDELKKKVRTAEIDEDAKRIIAEKETISTELQKTLDGVKAELEQTKQQIEAERAKKREQLLSSVADAKKKAALEKVTDVTLLEELISLDGKKVSDIRKGDIDFEGDIDVDTYRIMNPDQRLMLQSKNPTLFQKLVRATVK